MARRRYTLGTETTKARMEITEAQYQQIESCLRRQRGNVSALNLQVLNAILFTSL